MFYLDLLVFPVPAQEIASVNVRENASVTVSARGKGSGQDEPATGLQNVNPRKKWSGKGN